MRNYLISYNFVTKEEHTGNGSMTIISKNVISAFDILKENDIIKKFKSFAITNVYSERVEDES
jgi:hypothetical protein